MMTRPSRRDHRIETSTDSLVKCVNTVASLPWGTIIGVTSLNLFVFPRSTRPLPRSVGARRSPRTLVCGIGRVTSKIGDDTMPPALLFLLLRSFSALRGTLHTGAVKQTFSPLSLKNVPEYSPTQ